MVWHVTVGIKKLFNRWQGSRKPKKHHASRRAKKEASSPPGGQAAGHPHRLADLHRQGGNAPAGTAELRGLQGGRGMPTYHAC